MGENLEIIYDGECPFCAGYTALLRLRDAVGSVALIDARSGDPRVIEVQAAGYDLDAGMIVRYAGQTYHGADAMRVLASLSRPGLRGASMRLLFARSVTASVSYRLLSFGRRMALRLLRRHKISSDRPSE